MDISIMITLGEYAASHSVELSLGNLDPTSILTHIMTHLRSAGDAYSKLPGQYMDLRVEGHPEEVILNKMFGITSITINETKIVPDVDYPGVSNQGFLKALSAYKPIEIKLASCIVSTTDQIFSEALETAHTGIKFSCDSPDLVEDFLEFAKQQVEDEVTHSYVLDDHVNWNDYAKELLEQRYTCFKIGEMTYVFDAHDL